MDPAQEPQTLTIEEAAKVLRIGRTAAYALAREWRATHGRSGIPVLELGRTLRVPRQALQAMLAGAMTRPSEDPPPIAPRRPKAGRDGQVPLWIEPGDPAA